MHRALKTFWAGSVICSVLLSSYAYGAIDQLYGTEGKPIEIISISANGTSITPDSNKGFYKIKFPAGSVKPSASISLKETDVNDCLGIAIDVHNYHNEEAVIYGELNNEVWVRNYVALKKDETGTLYIFIRRKRLSDELVKKFPGMHGVPGGKMSLWSGLEEPIIAKSVRLFVMKPEEDVLIKVGNIRSFGSSKLPDIDPFFPFIDRYGQYKHKEWDGKISKDEDFKKVLERENIELLKYREPTNFNRFGGWKDGPILKATGHFYVEKYKGKWWLVDPEGRLFWSHGIDMVGFFLSSTRIQGREHFYENPPANGNYLMRNLSIKYGENWRDIVNDRLLTRIRSWGMNTLGGGADRAIVQKQKVPYTLLLSSGGRGIRIDPDNPEWVQSLRRNLSNAAERAKNDIWCIGFFVDNEIHVDNPEWWEKYYRKVREVAKDIMPEKLYLGSRLDYHEWPEVIKERKEIVKIAAKYCDVVSFNFYKFSLDDFVLPEGVDCPVIIGEFHFGALDRGLFHTGLRSVYDQNQRADAYRRYIKSALKSPYIVGAHWFQCYDESTTGRFDGENYQIGFLDICDTPYWETISAARDVGYQLYNIRLSYK